jgi:prepilin-type N-terminal cleavage/methylation domain-containing protein
MVKRAFTVIEMIIVVFILGFLIAFFAALITKEADENITELQQQISEYQNIIDSFKED